jgi:hypothetical protein
MLKIRFEKRSHFISDLPFGHLVGRFNLLNYIKINVLSKIENNAEMPRYRWSYNPGIGNCSGCTPAQKKN